MTNENNTLLTRQEVARLLRVSARTVRSYELNGQLHPKRLNARVVRYKADDVQALIDGQPDSKDARGDGTRA
jgi:predicted site-specific integrase-resolvase